MKILYKLIIDFIIVVVMVSSMGYISYVNITQADVSLRAVNNHVVPSLASLKDMKIACLRVMSSTMEERFLRNRISEGSEGYEMIKSEEALVAEGVELFNKSLGRYSISFEDFAEADEADLVSEIRDKWNIFFPLSRQMLAVGSGGDIQDILKHKEALEDAEEGLLEAIDRAIKKEESEISDWRTMIDSNTRQYINLVIIVIIITFFLTLISVFRNYRVFSIMEETEKKLADNNRQWFSNFNSMPDGAIMTDAEGMIIGTNKSLDEMVGKEARKKCAIAEDIFKSLGILPYLDSVRFNEAEAQEVRASKTNKWYSVARANVLNSKGVVTGRLFIVRDITMAKKMEENLANRNEELEKFRQIVVERELRMIELKKRIKDLEAGAGEKP